MEQQSRAVGRYHRSILEYLCPGCRGCIQTVSEQDTRCSMQGLALAQFTTDMEIRAFLAGVTRMDGDMTGFVGSQCQPLVDAQVIQSAEGTPRIVMHGSVGQPFEDQGGR